MIEEEAEMVTMTVLNIFRDRGGFSGWWDSIDDDIQEEILDEAVEAIMALE